MFWTRTNSNTAPYKSYSGLQFPGNQLIDDPALQGAATKLIWIVIPLEYYVLTRFDGGISADSYIPAAVMALACVVAIIVASAIVSLVRRRGSSYAARFRGWTVALLTIWCGSLTLLSLSYVGTNLYDGVHRDIVGTVICSLSNCIDYPTISWQTFLAYSFYSLVAAVLVDLSIRWAHLHLGRIIAKFFGDAENVEVPKDRIVDPNIITSSIVVATVMTVLHRASTVGWSALPF
jgi:hypothetical protein